LGEPLDSECRKKTKTGNNGKGRARQQDSHREGTIIQQIQRRRAMRGGKEKKKPQKGKRGPLLGAGEVTTFGVLCSDRRPELGRPRDLGKKNKAKNGIWERATR